MAGFVKVPSGQLVFQDDAGKVHLKGAAGDVQELSPEHAVAALADKYSGFAPASQAEIAKSAEATKAAAEAEKTSALGAAGRGFATGAVNAALAVPKLVTGLGSAALGVKDPLADYSGSGLVQDVGTVARHVGGESIGAAEDASREQMLADREQHGFARGAGELGGTILGALPLGGVATGAGRAGAAALGLAGRAASVAGGVGASVLEGSALASPVAAEAAWLKGDHDVTAEQTLSGIGLGGLFGLGAGVAVAGAGAGLSRLLGPKAAREAASLEGAAARATREEAAAAGATEESAGMFTPQEGSVLAEGAPAARAAPLESVSGGSAGRARKWLSGVSDEAAVKQVFHDQKPALRALGNGSAPTREVLADAGKFFNESGIAGFRSDSAALERATEVSEGAGKRIGDIMTKLDATAPYVEARPLVAKLQDFGLNLQRESWTPEQDAIARKILQRTTKIQEAADAGIVTHSDLWNYRRGLDTLSGWGKTAPNATKEAMRELRGMVETQLEQAVASGGGQDIGAEYMASKRAYRFGTAAKEALEERVGVRDISNNLFGLKDAGVGLATMLGTGGAALPSLGAAVGAKLVRERGWGALAAIARKAAGDAVDVSAAPASAIGTARNVQTMIAHSESRLQSSLGRFLGVGGESEGLARRGAVSWASRLRSDDADAARSAYKEHATEVQQVAANPQIAAERLTGITGESLAAVAPSLQTSMAAVAGRASQYLSANMPCPPSDPNSITPQLDEDPPVSASDLSTYADRVEGVEDPLSLVDDLHDGMISPEKVDAVKTVWPQVFARIQQSTMLALSQTTEPVPFEKRKLLDIALDAGGTIEPSMQPANIEVMRQAFKSVQVPQKPRSGKSPKSAQMLATRSQQLMKGM
jgi:hypothetical protein